MLYFLSQTHLHVSQWEHYLYDGSLLTTTYLTKHQETVEIVSTVGNSLNYTVTVIQILNQHLYAVQFVCIFCLKLFCTVVNEG